MAKGSKLQKSETEIPSQEMTLEEARSHRASLHVPQAPKLTETQKREEFRKFWASNKRKYGEAKDIEKALWLHLKTIGKTSPEHFQDGLKHFGLTKVK